MASELDSVFAFGRPELGTHFVIPSQSTTMVIWRHSAFREIYSLLIPNYILFSIILTSYDEFRPQTRRESRPQTCMESDTTIMGGTQNTCDYWCQLLQDRCRDFLLVTHNVDRCEFLHCTDHILDIKNTYLLPT